MRDSMYDVHFQVQKKHWWFVVKERIIRDMIARSCWRGRPLDILDAGCGPGLMLEGLKGYGRVHGMDFSERAVQFSRSKNIGDIRRGELPHAFAFNEKKFDLILALDVIEHIENDEESLRVLRTALKPGGTLLLTVPAYSFLWSRHDDLNEHKRRYTLQEVKKKLTSASFEVERISYYNTFLFPLVLLARMWQKLHNNESSSDLKIPPKFVNILLGWIFQMERPFLSAGVRFPFGVSVIALAKVK